MRKLKVTALQRANAILARDVMWPAVRDKNISPRLGSFGGYRDEETAEETVRPTNIWAPTHSGKRRTCGTTACFGGWCAVFPAFAAQGVIPSGDQTEGWMPMILNETGARVAYGFQVSTVLFGTPELFNARRATEKGTDHEIVTARLNKLINDSEVKS